jgi:hypothetical protein
MRRHPRPTSRVESHLLRRENNIIELGTQRDDKLGLSFAVERIFVIPTHQ